jgi:hypothetical protein
VEETSMSSEARQAKEAKIYRIVIGAWCLSLITFGVLGLMDIIHVQS